MANSVDRLISSFRFTRFQADVHLDVAFDPTTAEALQDQDISLDQVGETFSQLDRANPCLKCDFINRGIRALATATHTEPQDMEAVSMHCHPEDNQTALFNAISRFGRATHDMSGIQCELMHWVRTNILHLPQE